MQRSTLALAGNTFQMAGEKILVVDDNLATLKLAGFVLIAHGYDVRHALSADEALTAIEKELPDLVLLDLRLPGVDSLALVRQLKSAPATEDLIIVGLTEDPILSEDDNVLAAGCSGALIKPLDARTLPGRVASFFIGKKLK